MTPAPGGSPWEGDLPFRVDAGATVRSVYVHAPFCVRRCFYCDFAVDVRRDGGASGWLDALAGELAALEEEGLVRLGETLDTLYVGGGTPSVLGPGAMAGLRCLLGPGRFRDPGLEWTAEANPETFAPDLARAWRRAGVNRVSLGVQTFHEASLRWMGRLHGADGAEAAVRTARATGFGGVSMDLIFGLPEKLERSWTSDLDRALELEPTHVSLYGLTVEGGTPLGRAVREGRERPVDEQRYGEEYLLAAEALTGAGYEHYEVSNFALPGHASRHNSAYWEGTPYLGLGNAAHTYLHPLRRWNLRDWGEYQRRTCGRGLPVAGRELLSASQHRLERVWLELRTARGVALSGLSERGRERVERWIRDGLARAGPERFRLTAEGWLVLDRLAVELEEELEGAPLDDDSRARRSSTSHIVEPRGS